MEQESIEWVLFQKLGALYERTGRYAEAEKVYLDYNDLSPWDDGLQPLYQFYLRMVYRLPGQADWLLRSANLLCSHCLNQTKNYEFRENRFEDTFDAPDPSDDLSMVTEYYATWTKAKHLEKHPDLVYWPQVCEKPLALFDKAFPYLVHADERAAVLQKQGDIYLHLELPSEAEARYERALTHVPGREDIRDKVVGSYINRNLFRAALGHLAHQDTIGHLRFPGHIVLARMYNLDKRFTATDAIMTRAGRFILDEINLIRLDDLRAQRYLLAGDLAKARKQYEANAKAWHRTGEDAYGIARIYAKGGDQKNAFKWLEKALDQGFGQYTWVLARDPWMKGLRQTSRWKKVTNT